MTENTRIRKSAFSQPRRYSGETFSYTRGFGGLVVLFSFLLVFGCSTASEPVSPQPTTQDIRSDADRLFEKLDQEKLRKSETEP